MSLSVLVKSLLSHKIPQLSDTYDTFFSHSLHHYFGGLESFEQLFDVLLTVVDFTPSIDFCVIAISGKITAFT